ncbi:MAG: metallophosphatase family protein [Kitasatospora sp.]|jgi:predicted phosphodiesterase|nr:metallophosphatase family protein [Kitasatospora sp.]
MRVAVLADIHGNLPALEAVLRDVEDAGVDAVVLAGDLADGPMPAQTLDALEELGERAVWVRGNADRFLADAFDGRFVPSGLAANAPAEYFAWCASRIGQSQRDRLASLPLGVTVEIDGLGPVAFYHGTARDDNEFILVDSPISQYQAAFAGVPEPTVVIGHTHMPFDRLADTRRVINPGSVGLPYGHPGAAWAVLGPDVTLRRTAYDTRAAAAVLTAAAGDLPGLEDFIGNLTSSASDAEALAVFSDAAGEQARQRAAAEAEPT